MELRDVYRADGVRTGKVIEKGAPLSAGEYLYHVHIILIDHGGQYVMQQRARRAKYFPGMWDVTGGGVTSGETGDQAAAREAKEELGIDVDPARIRFAGRQIEHGEGGRHGLITDIFYARVDASHMNLSRREVEAVRLVPFAEFLETVTNNKTPEYRQILEQIDKSI